MDINDIYCQNNQLRIFSSGGMVAAKEFSDKKSDPYYTMFNRGGVKALGINYWNKKSPINLNLLQEAADTFNISKDIKDYVFTSFDIIGTNLPNSNHMTFVPDQILRYSSMYGNVLTRF